MARASLVIVLVLLASCGRQQEEQSPTASQSTNDESAHAKAHEAASKSPREAADVVNKYFELLNARRFHEAAQLWVPGDQAPEQSALDYESQRVQIGDPGRIEGAAGSLFISIPVRIDANHTSGEKSQLSGEITLRRSNDVPGATPEQLSWRIFRIDLQSAAAG